jgi:hypothetical protein
MFFPFWLLAAPARNIRQWPPYLSPVLRLRDLCRRFAHWYFSPSNPRSAFPFSQARFSPMPIFGVNPPFP